MSAALDSLPFEVVIVGLGPCGAIAAALLGRAGIRTLVIERAGGVYDKPRAIALDHEIMRVFQQLGVVDQVLPHTEPFTPSEYFGADGRLIKRLATIEPPYPLGYSPSLVFNQPAIERILRARVASCESVTVALDTEFVSLEQDGHGVRMQVRDATGACKQVRAGYVIGCDGASSAVRGAAGIRLDDLEFDEPWLVVDVLANERGIGKLPATSVQYCEPERPCTFVIGPKNHRRWEISLLPGEDPAYMATVEGTWRVLRRWITPDDAQLWRQASYRFHALVAASWRNGRVFIAGDAAHQQPPFLGQGMCQGVRDVVNLTWKLRAVLSGAAGDALLETYGVERGRHVRSLTSRIKGIGAVICERDPVRASERDERLLAAAGGLVRTEARQDILPPLEEGLLYGAGNLGAGKLFPQPRLSIDGDSVLMDEVAGCGWRVVTTMRLCDVPAALIDRILVFGKLLAITPGHTVIRGAGFVQAAEADGVLAQWFATHRCTIAVVRPDHYVYGTAGSIAGLAELFDGLAEVCGQAFSGGNAAGHTLVPA